MRAWITAVALMTFFVSNASKAEDTQSAGYMLPRCKAVLDDYVMRNNDSSKIVESLIAQADCMGKLMGIAYYGKSNNICLPSNVNNKQISAVIVKHIETYPFTWNLNFFLVAEVALHDVWPCK